MLVQSIALALRGIDDVTDKAIITTGEKSQFSANDFPVVWFLVT